MTTENITLSHVMRHWTVLVGLVTVVAMGAVAHYRVDANASETTELKNKVAQTEKDIESLRRDQIEAQGEVKLEVQRLQNDVDKIGDKIDLLIQLQRRENK